MARGAEDRASYIEGESLHEDEGSAVFNGPN